MVSGPASGTASGITGISKVLVSTQLLPHLVVRVYVVVAVGKALVSADKGERTEETGLHCQVTLLVLLLLPVSVRLSSWQMEAGLACMALVRSFNGVSVTESLFIQPEASMVT